jgi:ribose 5-phosphate isomerase A
MDIASKLDLAIDGADEIDNQNCLTKGGGAALLQEKIVAYSAKKLIVVADHSKIVADLGLTFPIALEVIPEAQTLVQHRLEKLGGKGSVREAERKIGPVITDNGNIIIDLLFERPQNPKVLENELNHIPGVVENGLFSQGDIEVFIAQKDGTVFKKQ